MSAGRLPALDGLRLVCCALVVVAHAWWGPVTGRMAGLGVDLFFVLSGFVITRLLLRELAGTGTIHLGRFYERRARRILPVYYAALLVGFGLSWSGRDPFVRILRGMPAPGVDTALAYTVFAGNLSHAPVISPLEILWSVCIEEQFYLLFPLVLRCSKGPLPALRPALWGLALAWATRCWLAHRGDVGLFRNPLAHADGLLCGVLLAQLEAARPAVLRPSERGRPVLSEVFVVAVAAAHVLFRSPSLSPLSYWFSFLASALLGAAAIATLARGGGPLAALLSTRPAVALGRLTYGGYVGHMYAVMAAWSLAAMLAPGMVETPLCLVLSLVFTFALAWLVERLIERPFRAPVASASD